LAGHCVVRKIFRAFGHDGGILAYSLFVRFSKTPLQTTEGWALRPSGTAEGSLRSRAHLKMAATSGARAT
jgi:hypothetical protein